MSPAALAARGPHVAFLAQYVALHEVEARAAALFEADADGDAMERSPPSFLPAVASPSPLSAAAAYAASDDFAADAKRSLFVSLVAKHRLLPLEALLVRRLRAEEEQLHSDATNGDADRSSGQATAAPSFGSCPPPASYAGTAANETPFSPSPSISSPHLPFLSMDEATLSHHLAQHRMACLFVARYPPSTPAQRLLWGSYVAWVQGGGGDGVPSEDEGVADVDEEAESDDHNGFSASPVVGDSTVRHWGGTSSADSAEASIDPAAHRAALCAALYGAVGPIATAEALARAHVAARPLALTEPVLGGAADAEASPLPAHAQPNRGRSTSAGAPPPRRSPSGGGALLAPAGQRKAVSVPYHHYHHHDPHQASFSPAAQALVTLQCCYYVLGIDPLILAACAGYGFYPTAATVAAARRQLAHTMGAPTSVVGRADVPSEGPPQGPSSDSGASAAPLAAAEVVTSPQLCPLPSSAATTAAACASREVAAKARLGAPAVSIVSLPVPRGSVPLAQGGASSSASHSQGGVGLGGGAAVEKEQLGYHVLLAHHAVNLVSDVVFVQHMPVLTEGDEGAEAEVYAEEAVGAASV